jgi:hypothetical protein
VSIDNTTNYQSNPIIIPATTNRNQTTESIESLKSAYSNAFCIAIASLNESNNTSSKTTINELLNTTKNDQQENKSQDNKIDKNNNKNNDQHNNLNKDILNKNEIRNTEIQNEYTDQLERREQIKNEYANKLNQKNNINLEVANADSTNLMNNPTQKNNTGIFPQLQPAAQHNTTINNPNKTDLTRQTNTAKSNDIPAFLNASNIKEVVRGILQDRQDKTKNNQNTQLPTNITPIPIELPRQTIPIHQNTFTIFNTTGQIDQIEYDEEQNKKQHDENNNEKNNKKNKKHEQKEIENTSRILSEIFLTTQEQNSFDQKNQNDNIPNNDGEVGLAGVGVDVARGGVEILPEVLPDGLEVLEGVDVEIEVAAGLSELDWRRRLMMRVASACRSIANRDGIFRIKLNLDELGELTIKIKSKKNSYSIQFTTTTQTANENIRKNIDHLKRLLAEDDIKIDNVTTEYVHDNT